MQYKSFLAYPSGRMFIWMDGYNNTILHLEVYLNTVSIYKGGKSYRPKLPESWPNLHWITLAGNPLPLLEYISLTLQDRDHFDWVEKAIDGIFQAHLEKPTI